MAARDLIQQNVIKSFFSMGRGHSQPSGPKLNSEALGTMSSHLRRESGLSIPEWGLEVGDGGSYKEVPRRGLSACPK